MSKRCPSLERVGLNNFIVEYFQRFFDTVQQGLMKSCSIEKKHKDVISNAGYHLMIWEVNKIIDACSNKRDRMLIETLAFTGMRRAEVVNLTFQDILWNKSLLHIRHGKGGKQRLIPIPDKLLDNLKKLLGNRSHGEVFLSKKGGKFSVRQINRIVANAGKKAGVKNPNPKYANITCHLFRHTFARLWKDQRGSIESLSAILGHQSVRTTWDVYGKESMEDIKDNYNRTIMKMYDIKQSRNGRTVTQN